MIVINALATAYGSSACEAPIQQLPTEREVAVSAAVTGLTANGAAGGGSHTDFSGVLLSSDALERSWILYTLCREHERKAITDDEYVAERRYVLGMVDQGPAPAAPTITTTSNDTDPAVGRWSVDSTPVSLGCAPTMASAYEWNIYPRRSFELDYGLQIDVLTQSNYPLMSDVSDGTQGQQTHPNYQFSGPSIAGSGAAWVGFDVSGDTLVGTRVVVTALQDGTLCVLTYDLAGRRAH
jgi:hypothetical protein